MIFNCGPEDNDLTIGLEFNFGGSKINPITDIEISANFHDFTPLAITPMSATATGELYDFYYEENNAWDLLIYTACQIKFAKTVNHLQIGAVGAGGCGGTSKVGDGDDASYACGGGGGSGGEIASLLDQQIPRGQYSIHIGNYTPLSGIPEAQTTVYNTSTNFGSILSVSGGVNGADVKGSKYIDNPALGGNGDGCQKGGNGATICYDDYDYNYNHTKGIPGTDGDPGLQMFLTTFFQNGKDNPYVGAGGGGGRAQSYNNGQSSRAGGNNGNPGHEYGGGGMGGCDGPGSNGTNGLLIIRGIL